MWKRQIADLMKGYKPKKKVLAREEALTTRLAKYVKEHGPVSVIELRKAFPFDKPKSVSKAVSDITCKPKLHGVHIAGRRAGGAMVLEYRP